MKLIKLAIIKFSISFQFYTIYKLMLKGGERDIMSVKSKKHIGSSYNQSAYYAYFRSGRLH